MNEPSSASDREALAPGGLRSPGGRAEPATGRAGIGLSPRRRRDDTCRRVTDALRSQVRREPFEVFVLDEVGPLEVNGGGFAGLLREVLSSDTRAVVAAVRPGLLPEVVRTFDLADPVVLDLDAVSPAQALRTCLRRSHASRTRSARPRGAAFAGPLGARRPRRSAAAPGARALLRFDPADSGVRQPLQDRRRHPGRARPVRVVRGPAGCHECARPNRGRGERLDLLSKKQATRLTARVISANIRRGPWKKGFLAWRGQDFAAWAV